VVECLLVLLLLLLIVLSLFPTDGSVICNIHDGGGRCLLLPFPPLVAATINSYCDFQTHNSLG